MKQAHKQIFPFSLMKARYRQIHNHKISTHPAQ